jgi:hypothetical protein
MDEAFFWFGELCVKIDSVNSIITGTEFHCFLFSKQTGYLIEIEFTRKPKDGANGFG